MAPAKLNDGTGVVVEITEEDEHVIDVLFDHPTRDDVHEQREEGQVYEAVIHAHIHIAVGRSGR